MNEGEGLGRLIRMRNYEKLSYEVDMLIQCKGWPSVIEILRKMRDKSLPLAAESTFYEKPTLTLHPTKQWGIYRGTFRDALVHILRIPRGLDVDHIELTEDLEVSSLDELRKYTFKRGLKALDSQITTGNTFFLEFESGADFDLIAYGYSDKIPSIIKTRLAEIQSLPKKPTLRDIVRTYYGFNLMILGSLHHTGAGITEEFRDSITAFLDEITEVEKPKRTRLQFDLSLFSHCTLPTASLLLGIMKMGIGAIETHLEGVETLGRLGDSRAIRYLISNLESEKNDAARRSRYYRKPSKKHERKKTLYALGDIGDPESFDAVLKIYEVDKSPESVKAISGIKHPQTKEVLLSIIEQEKVKLVNVALGGLWHLRDSSVLTILRDNLRKKPKSYCYEVLRSLLLMGKEGHQVIYEETEYIARALNKKSTFLNLFKLIKSIPKLLDDDRIIDEIAKHVETSDTFIPTYDTIKQIDNLVYNPRMYEAFAEILRNNPTHVLYRIDHLVNDSDELSKALSEGTDNFLNSILSFKPSSYDVIFKWCMKFNALYEQKKVRETLIQLLFEQLGSPYIFTHENILLLAIIIKRMKTAIDPRIKPLIIQRLFEGDVTIFSSLEDIPELLNDDEVLDACRHWARKVDENLEAIGYQITKKGDFLRRYDTIGKIPKLLEDRSFMELILPRLIKAAQESPIILTGTVNRTPNILDIPPIQDIINRFLEDKKITQCPFCKKYYMKHERCTSCKKSSF